MCIPALHRLPNRQNSPVPLEGLASPQQEAHPLATQGQRFCLPLPLPAKGASATQARCTLLSSSTTTALSHRNFKLPPELLEKKKQTHRG